jgi:hypothetical protein
MKITTTLSSGFLPGTSYPPAAMVRTVTGTPGLPRHDQRRSDLREKWMIGANQ